MERLKNKVVGLDTMIFIYHFDNNQKYSPLTYLILESMENGQFQGITSTLTLLELLVKPKKEKNQFISDKYKLILQNFPNLQIKSLDEEIVDIASDIRAKYAINTPDAIQIATSLSARADYFLTNDLYLKKIQDLEILLLDDIEKDKSPFN